MKNLFAIAFTLLLTQFCTAQNVSKLNFSRAGNLEYIVIGLDEFNVIYLQKDGSISKWGYDRYAARGGENYAADLDPYAGRVENYAATDDAAFRGKIKYIGKYLVTYYASYDNTGLPGKIKSIGTLAINYYEAFENEAFKGNIKTLGGNTLTWYSSFENEAYRGKLKSLGITNIVYYGSFEDKEVRGKIKTLGNSSFTWYSSFDLQDYRGAMKTGQQMQTIGGIKYFVGG
jgi:hypothetical protein